MTGITLINVFESFLANEIRNSVYNDVFKIILTLTSFNALHNLKNKKYI